MRDVAIIGAGLLGRVLSIELLKRGFYLSLFEKDRFGEYSAAGYSAAGMLALFAELESAESIIFEYGKSSIKLWRDILKEIGASELYMQKGTVVVAHPQDFSELDHFIEILQTKIEEASEIEELNSDEIALLEPDLAQHKRAFYIPSEGIIHAQEFFERSTHYLNNHPNLKWFDSKEVDSLEDYKSSFDLVFDVRGVGSKKESLRGVRGEVLHIESSEINLTRPIRFMHPRYRLYIVPRGEGKYLIGATEIESDDSSPVSVRSSLELLSALYALHSSFGEARVIKCDTNLRPALSDNLPKITKEDNCITINGLYRHGYLIAPAIVDMVLKEFIDD